MSYKNIVKDKKAQVDAPFEVLVAVILMGFVILAGSYALRNLSQNICIGDKRNDISEFRNALREVVLGSDLTFKNFHLRSKHCFNREHEYMRLVTYTDQYRCSAYCQSLATTCTLIEYYYDDGKSKTFPIPPICADLPSAINFVTTGEENDPCGTLENNERLLQQSRDGSYPITPGYYRMFRQEMGEGTKICVIVNETY
jgi:type II secretory pathway pseudopilin PulG